MEEKGLCPELVKRIPWLQKRWIRWHPKNPKELHLEFPLFGSGELRVLGTNCGIGCREDINKELELRVHGCNVLLDRYLSHCRLFQHYLYSGLVFTSCTCDIKPQLWNVLAHIMREQKTGLKKVVATTVQLMGILRKRLFLLKDLTGYVGKMLFSMLKNDLIEELNS